MIEIHDERVGDIAVIHAVPAGQYHRPLPTVFFCHGYTSSKEVYAYFAYALARAGFRAVLPDADRHGERFDGDEAQRLASFWEILRSNIDELPQIFNVLKGELSLVGPRPHAVLAQTQNRTYSDVVEGYFARHRVKPGVTGWAQINGWRGEIDNDDKIRLRTAFDLHYIENWSLLFDLKILFLTPFRLLNTENAY